MQVNPAAAGRREQIAEAAVRVIGTHGFAACTFKRIAEEAGLSSTRLVSYHFEDKDELLMTVLTSAVGLADALLESRVDHTASRVDALRAYVESRVAFLEEHPHHARALLEIGRHSPTYAPVTTDFATGRLERQLRQGVQEGTFREVDPALTAHSLNAAVDAVTTRRAADPDLDVSAYGTAIADLFLRGLVQPSSSAVG